MKHLAAALTLISFVLSVNSQTRYIFHKSHSGHSGLLEAALENNFADASSPGLGMAPMEYVRHARLDSLVVLDSNRVLMVTSRCGGTSNETSPLWSPGREIVLDHPLFNAKNSTDSIRSVLTKRYHFVNPADSVKLVGFKESRQEAQIQELSPSLFIWMLSGLIIASFFVHSVPKN